MNLIRRIDRRISSWLDIDEWARRLDDLDPMEDIDQLFEDDRP